MKKTANSIYMSNKDKLRDILSENKLNEIIRLRNTVRIEGDKKDFGGDFTYPQFLKIMFAYFTSQSYGAKIEKRLIKDLGLSKISSQKDRGDAVKQTKSGDIYFEIKITFKNINNEFSFVQLRQHQKLDFYILHCINPDENFKTYNFLLSKSKMNDLMKDFGARNCHGVVINKINREQEEKRMTVIFKSDAWGYLVKGYFGDCKLNCAI
jgi:hypothetical protein